MQPGAVVRTEFQSRLDADVERRERSGADADDQAMTDHHPARRTATCAKTALAAVEAE
jgi:hypothetical protein